MAQGGRPSIRIDWFDGSLVEDVNPSTSASQFADEDEKKSEPNKTHQKSAQTLKLPIGFKRLQDISLLKPVNLNIEVANRPGFWNLFDQEELKGDFIVLIVRILSNVFKYIQPGEKSKITNLLQTRFFGSDFLEKLIIYVNLLPKVKIVEKWTNAQLWDDVQDFFSKTLDLCEGCIEFFGEKRNKEVDKKLYELLKAVLASAIGVAEEHSELFNDEFFYRIEDLEAKVEVKNEIESAGTQVVQKSKDPNSFVNLNIFPTQADLLPHKIVNGPDLTYSTSDNVTTGGVVIQPNIINGAYPSIEHYLDIQFKLLREDYIGPLREGISKYLENPSKKKHEHIRVFLGARVLRTHVSNNKVGHLVDLAWEQRSSLLTIKKINHNNGLKFGSLLLFTNNEFNTFLCATVLDSSTELLRQGYLVVLFHQPVSKNILSETFLMLESEIFFEPYHQVLKVLQNSRLDTMPMKRYIIDVVPEMRPPAYLTRETIYTIEGPERSEIPFSVLDTDFWPSDYFGLDASQLQTLKFALTREFAVIQGPPGTGKTFLGVKIASMLLRNLSLHGTPLLIICYTNHALDQFLERVLKFTDSIIRLGSQSKSEELEPYKLNNVRSKLKCKYSYLYSSKREELQWIYKNITDLQTEIVMCESEILSYRLIKPYLKIDGKEYKLRGSTDDCLLNWLFEHLEESRMPPKSEGFGHVEADSWENLEFDSTGSIETCFSEKKAQSDVKSINKMIKHVAANKETFDAEVVPKLEREIIKINKRLQCFKSQIASHKQHKEANPIDRVDDLHSLRTKQRWQLYFRAVTEIKNKLLSKMDALLEKHKIASDDLEEVATLIDENVISTVRVVGVTTTAAARRHQLIKKMKSPIVIVEEAAHAFEAHIIASLTLRCQHLILIGDHKQLRPSGGNFKLVKDHYMDISLFERMIRNGIHARTLTIQRRMRPNFAQLLVPEIYEKLDSHESVLRYPDVKGLVGNLYFFTHEQPEDFEARDDGRSHSNRVEAQWCVTLAKYIRNQGYGADDVTILTTYKAQASLIEKIIGAHEYLTGIKVTTVDNFQGEESRIVILSLVRSNRDGRIGFLSATNRVCVALSRAKEGFYMLGNMTMLRSASQLWKSISDKLTAQNAIGDKMSEIEAELQSNLTRNNLCSIS